MTKQLDVLVIGSGPAGLSAAIYAKRANLNVMVAEKEFMGIGQIAESSNVDNYLGFAGINGYELGAAFRQHAEALEVPFYDGEVTGLEQRDGVWTTAFADGSTLESKAVIYCAGAAHRHLNVPGEKEYGGRGVSYCAVCDGAFFRGKTAAVIGGGDTALDDALYLSELCAKVYVIHRRDTFRGAARAAERLRKKENVEFVLNAVVQEFTGREQKADGIVLTDGRRIDVDGIFVAVGMLPQTDCLKGVARLDEAGYVAADETGVTDAPGLFAAGDVRTKRLRQVATAVSDGANAVTSAMEYISAGV